jgi:hypothetical protein
VSRHLGIGAGQPKVQAPHQHVELLACQNRMNTLQGHSGHKQHDLVACLHQAHKLCIILTQAAAGADCWKARDWALWQQDEAAVSRD